MVVSPRSYFVFTPLLASTAVGTLEFRTTLETVRGKGKGVEFFQGWADDVNFNEKRLSIEESTRDRALPGNDKGPKEEKGLTPRKGETFDLKYDKLVVAVGCYSQTFNTPGVRENALFLKDVKDAQNIRKRILECMVGPVSTVLAQTNTKQVSRSRRVQQHHQNFEINFLTLPL